MDYGDLQTLSRILRTDFERSGTLEGVDRGVPARHWPDRGPPELQVEGQGDGVQDTAEILQEAFQRLETVAYGRADFASEIGATSNEPSFYRLFQRNAGSLPPWLLDDGNPSTSADADLRRRIDRIAQGTLRSARSRSELTDLLLVSLSDPLDRGGLGVQYDDAQAFWARDGISTFQAGRGACHGIAFLFYALAKRAGLHPSFIRICGQRNTRTGAMKEIFHIGVAVSLDPSHPDQLTPLDPSLGRRLDARNFQWYRISSIEMAAYQLRNTAFYDVPANLTAAETLSWQENLLRQALTLAPRDFEILQDMAWFYRSRRHDPANSEAYRQRALAVNPRATTIWR